ncbi:MAG: hypothetical protein IJZ85_06110 [Lachnospiraceae bacterium]|nr:hypothetical protein [Lachnospiraceae bacterium]
MPVINISNGTIREISSDRGTRLVTVTYLDGPRNRRTEQTVRLVVTQRTIILGSNGNPVPPSALRVGMIINATISSAMTRSIPPQSTAYLIRIIRSPQQDVMTTGNILEIDRRNRSFTTISGRDVSTIIRFNVPENARILDRQGRPIRFDRLTPGMRVRVRHADFMTASIPPQTTAFEIRVL